VLLPSAPDFLVLANGLRTLRTRRPAAVVFPTTVVQVQRALGCAAAAGVAPIPRSGGFRWVADFVLHACMPAAGGASVSRRRAHSSATFWTLFGAPCESPGTAQCYVSSMAIF
jgi:hypothetical protein